MYYIIRILIVYLYWHLQDKIILCREMLKGEKRNFTNILEQVFGIPNKKATRFISKTYICTSAKVLDGGYVFTCLVCLLRWSVQFVCPSICSPSTYVSMTAKIHMLNDREFCIWHEGKYYLKPFWLGIKQFSRWFYLKLISDIYYKLGWWILYSYSAEFSPISESPWHAIRPHLVTPCNPWSLNAKNMTSRLYCIWDFLLSLASQHELSKGHIDMPLRVTFI